MKRRIKSLSPKSELLIVLIIGLGWFIYSSTTSFLIVNSNFEHSWSYQLTDGWHYTLIVYELFASLIIGYFLYIRGWSFLDFNLKFTFRFIWTALLLMWFSNLLGRLSVYFLEITNSIGESFTNHVKYQSHASIISMALIVVVNSIYEEFILIGYLFKRLQKYHPVLIIGISLVIRLSYHTYQGWSMFATLIPLGLVYGYYYYKRQKLWPIIVAHGMNNLMVFLTM